MLENAGAEVKERPVTNKKGAVARKGRRRAEGSRAGVPDARSQIPQESVFRIADREFHSALASLTLGLSPFSLAGAWFDWALHLAISPGKQYEIAAKSVDKGTALWRFMLECALHKDGVRHCIEPLPQDRRFNDPAWETFPFNVIQQSFLAVQEIWDVATVGVPGVNSQHERVVEFYSRQLLDMVSPSNFVPTNPEVIRRAVEEGGANFARGFQHLIEDLQRIVRDERPVGTEAFQVGVNIAVTEGEVVLRNDFMELIQYRPSTEKVRPEPVLIVPAWIMKYYILDLSPHNSLIRYLVGQGFTVFCISWRNPGPEMRDAGFDDYRRHGVMAALDAVETITGAGKIHGVGYCLGGTLLALAAAAMARDKDERLATVTFLAAQVDFDEPGELGLFVDESQVSFLEDVMWRRGYLDQRHMAGAFQMLRSQDLIWSRIVREYLLGERSTMSDLMAWNADATRMPYRMHSDYLRKLYIGNDLAQGRFEVDGHPVHIEDVRAPVFAVGTVTDHVSPWRSVYKLTRIFATDVDFVLTTGGHNAGIVSEPGHPRRSYRHLEHRHHEMHPPPESWAAGTPENPGSWWPLWTSWLSERSSPEVPPPPLGREPYAPIGPAPGDYVMEP
jgi:polyhydroxyalkanoate synthase subunit PhaC